MKTHPIRDPRLIAEVEQRTRELLERHRGTGQVFVLLDFKDVDDTRDAGQITYRIQVQGPRQLLTHPKRRS